MIDINDQETKLAIQVIKMIGKTVRETGSLPSGFLYSYLADMMTLGTFYAAIGVLANAGLVRDDGDELTWVGP